MEMDLKKIALIIIISDVTTGSHRDVTLYNTRWDLQLFN